MRKIIYTVRTMISPTTLIILFFVTLLRTVTSYPFRIRGTLADLVLTLYGGVEWDMFITFRQIAYWIMFLMPYLFGIVQYYTYEFQHNLRLTLYRAKSRLSWWSSELISLTLYVAILTMLSVFLSLLFGSLAGMRGLQMYTVDDAGFYSVSLTRWLLAPTMATLNTLLCAYLYANSYLLLRDSRISVFLYIVPTLLHLLMHSNEERLEEISCVFNWCMVQRYALLSENGISETQAILQFVFVLGCAFILGLIVSKYKNPFQNQRR